jgi:hypothetical protein
MTDPAPFDWDGWFDSATPLAEPAPEAALPAARDSMRVPPAATTAAPPALPEAFAAEWTDDWVGDAWKPADAPGHALGSVGTAALANPFEDEPEAATQPEQPSTAGPAGRDDAEAADSHFRATPHAVPEPSPADSADEFSQREGEQPAPASPFEAVAEL